MYFYGYCSGEAWLQPCRTHSDMIEKGKEVENKTATVTETGINGVPIFSQYLDYFNIVEQFAIEVFHPLIEDYPLTFWKAVFADYK